MSGQAPESTASEQGTSHARYENLATNRIVYLERGRDSSKLSIPSLIPPEGHSSSTRLYKPFQSVGARGVNNLASKLLLALLPPNSPFFRYKINSYLTRQLSSDEKAKSKIEEALGDAERSVQDEIESCGDRVAVFELLKQLIVGGNVLAYVGPDHMRVFPLDRYVVLRDPQGNVLEIIVKECVAPATLSDSLLGQLGDKVKSADKTIDIYTHVKRRPKDYSVRQEICGLLVEGSEGSYPLDKTPWLPLRMMRIDGEDYGRGYIEEYIGDLMSLEGLSQAIVEGSAAAARVLYMVKPGSTTRQKTIEQAANLAVVPGNATDVTVLQLQKSSDFSVASNTANRIEERLATAFLLNTSVQRDAERVTAEEIRYVAQELEDALGGIYSILTQEFQLPYARRRAAIMEKAGRLPKLPQDLVKLTIVAGMEALGRGHDSLKLMEFLGTLQKVFGPEITAQYVEVDEAIRRFATSKGIDSKGLVKTPEQIAAAQQAAQQQQMIAQLGPDAIKAGAQAMQQRGK